MSPGVYVDVRLDEMGTDPGGSGVRRPDSERSPAPEKGASAIQQSPFAGKGYLLEEQDDGKVFKAIDEIVERQEQLAKNREAARKHRARVRKGVPFSILNKDEDRNVWTAELPPGGTDSPSPIPNKADELCRKTVGQIIVDLPAPDPKPATDSEQDRGAADLAKRFLKTDGDESGTHDAEMFREILDAAQTAASEFAHVWCDPTGDGWRPLKIKAHPQAQDPNNPLVALDPLSGMEIPTADYVFRYVSEQGQFVETAAEAAKQWMPKIKRDILAPANVRTVPETANVANAEAVILLMCGPVSDLKRRAPDLQQWDEGQLQVLATWKPRRAKVLVPESLRAKFKDQSAHSGSLSVSDDTLVFWYQKYCRVGNAYPEGADMIVTGADGGMVLGRATLRTDLPDEDGDVFVLLADIPVSQCKSLSDTEHKDPFGKCPIDNYGATNEGLANLYGAVHEDTDKRLHPNMFLPSTSPVQTWQVNQRTGEPILVYSKDDLPMYEEFADLAPFVPQVIDRMENSMEDAAGLGSAAENLNTPDAKSGVAKSIELNQAKVHLAEQAQNFFSFAKRYWRIKLQKAQAKLTLPQQVEYAGVDQAYKQRWWSGADFAGVKDVAIQAGTGTMMSPVEKQQYLSFAQQSLWLDPEEAGKLGLSTMADDLGVTPSPHEDTIKRELAQWMDGPPDEMWLQHAQAFQQEQDALQAAAQQNPGSAPMQPQVPAPWSPFVPRPTDEDPSVAKKQYAVLRDFVASADYTKHPPEWRGILDQRLLLARQAAGIATIREQQEAQAQQAEADRQMKREQMDATLADKDKDREAQRQEGDLNRAAKAQQGALAA